MSASTAEQVTAAGASPPGQRLSHRQILSVLAGLMLGMFLAALDQTIVTSAIRTIGDDLHGLSVQAWVTTAYLITATISTPLYGKLSDIYGRKRFFLAAITIFVIGSFACSFATSMYMLAGFRAFQGLGAGGLFSLALAIIGDIVAPRERARYQGYFLAVFGTSSVLGPVIGGFFAGADSILGIAGWRWVFLVNVPVGILALIVVAKVLHLQHTPRDHRIDWWGAITICVCLVPLLTVAEQGRTWGWGSDRSILCYVVGGAGLVLFLLAEYLMKQEALIPLRFFRNPTFSLTSAAGFIVGMGMFGGLALLPLYLQIVRGATPTESGLQLLPLTAGIMLGSIISGQLISRTGRYKIYPILGSALMVIALWLLHTVGLDTAFWRTGVFMGVFGVGLGFVMQPITLAVQNAMEPRDIGVATSSVTFFRQMGATAGTAIFLSLLFSTVGDKIQDAYKTAATTPAFQQALADPSVTGNPANKSIVDALHGGGALGDSALNDTSFLAKVTPILARPFKDGFSDSMDAIFVIAAIVLVLAFLLLLFLPQLPLRTQAGSAAREQPAEGEPPTGSVPSEAEATAAAGRSGDDARDRTDGRAEPDARAGAGARTDAPSGAGMGAGTTGPAGIGAGAATTGLAGPGTGASANDPSGAGMAAGLRGVAGAGAGAGAGADAGRNGLAGVDGRGETDASGATHGRTGAHEGVELTEAHRPSTLADLDQPREPLSNEAVLSGRVDGPGAVPVAGATVTVTDFGGGQLARAATGNDGTYRLVIPTGGTFLFVCAAPHLQPAASMITVAGGRLHRDVSLAGGGQILGTITDPEGTPIPGATLTLIDARGEVVGTAVSSPTGEYALTGLYPAQYTLTATAGSSRPSACGVRLDENPVARVDLVLVANGSLTGTVLAAASGRPVPEASVMVIDQSGTVAGATVTGADGRYELADLAPGQYTVTASGYAPVATRVELTGDSTEHDILLGTATPNGTPGLHATPTREGTPLASTEDRREVSPAPSPEGYRTPEPASGQDGPAVGNATSKVYRIPQPASGQDGPAVGNATPEVYRIPQPASGQDGPAAGNATPEVYRIPQPAPDQDGSAVDSAPGGSHEAPDGGDARPGVAYGGEESDRSAVEGDRSAAAADRSEAGGGSASGGHRAADDFVGGQQ